MNWESIFNELESQLEGQVRAHLAQEVPDLVQAEAATVLAAARLRSQLGKELTIGLRSGDIISAKLVDSAPAWLLLGKGTGRILIPTNAIVTVKPLARAAPQGGRVATQLSFAYALRALARLGERVRLSAGSISLIGTIMQVGRDHFELKTSAGTPEMVLVMMDSVDLIRTL